jgi:hypothetical protein
MLRCLTIRCLVARHTDDGDARYSSVRRTAQAEISNEFWLSFPVQVNFIFVIHQCGCDPK